MRCRTLLSFSLLNKYKNKKKCLEKTTKHKTQEGINLKISRNEKLSHTKEVFLDPPIKYYVSKMVSQTSKQINRKQAKTLCSCMHEYIFI